MIDQDDRDEKIFCLIKSNYCNEPTGLKFGIVDTGSKYGAGGARFSMNCFCDNWLV